MKSRICLVFACLIFSTAPKLAHAYERNVAACLVEQMAMDGTLDALAKFSADRATGVLVGKPPGRLIMLGPFGDPQFAAPGWEKWGSNNIGSYTVPNRVLGQTYSYTTMRTNIELHYMVNSITGQFAQVKFKNTAEAGCVGKEVMTKFGLSSESLSPDNIQNVAIMDAPVTKAYNDGIDGGGDCYGRNPVQVTYTPNYQFQVYGIVESFGRVVVTAGWTDAGGQLSYSQAAPRGGCR